MNMICKLKQSTLAAALFIGLAPIGTNAHAEALGTTKQLTATVNYGELDLSSSQGVATLYHRLRVAAQEVCAPFEGRELSKRARFQACYSEALDKAVAKVNRETLTAFHVRSMQAQKAS